MKKGIYICKNTYCGGTEYKLLATKRFVKNLKLAGVLLAGMGVIYFFFF